MKRNIIFAILFSIFYCYFFIFPAGAQNSGPSANFSPAGVTKVPEVTINTEKDDFSEAKREAEIIIEEKKTIEVEAQKKEEAAAIAQQELELLKKEVQINSDPQLMKQLRQLIIESEQLNKEAALAQEKLKIAEMKAQSAQQRLDFYQSRRPMREKAIMSLVIVGVGVFFFIAMKILLRWFERAVTKKDVIREDATTLRLKTLLKLLRWLSNIVIISIVIYMILGTFGFDVAPLLAGAGVAGLALGFGGQYLIRDIINGLFILFEDQYRVNDVVKINDYAGLVEDINLRITVLRDLEGRVIIVPNGEVKTVVNFTREFSYALFDIGIAYKENVDRVMDIIKDIGQQMCNDPYFGRLIMAPLEMFGVDNFADSQVTIKFRIKTLPIKQWEVAREFRRRLKNKFDELGIEIPFPHRTLYWGSGSDNDWLRNFAQFKITKNSQPKP